MSKKPIALIIMDGFGYNHKDYGNAIRAAKTPNIDRLLANYPHTLIGASGMDVGLPEGQMGNSEVGHTNIGAGRIVYQELTRITKSIKDGEFFSNEAFTAAVENCKKNDSEAVSIARHEMLCTIDDVCRCAKKNLKFGGRLCICNRPERLCDIMTAMRASGIEPKRLRTVHKNPECPPWLILVEGKKGGKPFVQIEKPLYVRSADGGNSAEMKRIYGLE